MPCRAGVGDGDRFCAQCGATLMRPCPSCGAENPPANRFCPSCGTELTDTPGPPPQGSERRLVSVLFADLVGFTALSEHRDPEEVRELLSAASVAGERLFEAHGLAIEAVIALGDEAALAELERFVAELPPARAAPLLRAGRARVLAELAHRRGEAQAAIGFEDEAIDLLRTVGARLPLAKALLERARRRPDPEALAA